MGKLTSTLKKILKITKDKKGSYHRLEDSRDTNAKHSCGLQILNQKADISKAADLCHFISAAVQLFVQF